VQAWVLEPVQVLVQVLVLGLVLVLVQVLELGQHNRQESTHSPIQSLMGLQIIFSLFLPPFLLTYLPTLYIQIIVTPPLRHLSIDLKLSRIPNLSNSN